MVISSIFLKSAEKITVVVIHFKKDILNLCQENIQPIPYFLFMTKILLSFFIFTIYHILVSLVRLYSDLTKFCIRKSVVKIILVNLHLDIFSYAFIIHIKCSLGENLTY